METGFFKIIKGNSPVIATAIHSGHHVRKEVSDKLLLTEDERLREEDPFTEKFIRFSPTQIIVNSSRFEFDLNRIEEKAIYLTPAEAWGFTVWRERPSEKIIERSLSHYRKFYAEVKTLLNEYVSRYGEIFIYDVHSYNYRRKGPENDADDPEKNPDINIGTGNIDNEYWKNLIKDFKDDLSSFDIEGHKLDVRQNIKFKGGHFSRWINANYGNRICVLSIEIKKIFMNEWTGEIFPDRFALLKKAIQSTMPRVVKNLKSNFSEKRRNVI
ncbi:MAG: N-formylglutamate amidohydrolase [Ignavibacteria bacterium]|nr:N-formylglutamate amidohydrolase [Ignavibacteria bacterium]